MSRGELHASKWCRGTKKRSIKEGEGRERNLASQGVTAIYIDKKGKFRPRAGNNIPRAKARHTLEYFGHITFLLEISTVL